MLIDFAAATADGAAFDVVVLGAGGAGMSAALVAAAAGARVLVVERTHHVGGTTAWSGGTTWIPCTAHAAGVGADDDTLEAAERYLTEAVGERTPAALRRAFLRHGAEALAFVERHSSLRYRAYPLHPDYLSGLPGSTVKGRALEPLPFDGRELGAHFALLRPPIPEFTVLSGMMVDRSDIYHLLRMRRSFASLAYATRILLRHAKDRLRYPRGTRLVMGNALVGRLLHSLAQRDNVRLLMDTAVTGFVRDADGVAAVTLTRDGTARTVRVTGGVILATGGFNRDPALRSAWLPGIDATWCPGAPGHTGEAHAPARAAGARYGERAMSAAFWAPVSLRQRADGSVAAFPHFLMDRGKPGMIAVDARGERFVNETTSYHLFALAMQAAPETRIPTYLIADARAVRSYGIGMVRPGGRGLDAFVADGYLARATTLRELAAGLDIDPSRLEATVARFNGHAASGADPDFQRGTTAYQRNLGDPAWTGANPTIGALTTAPFYAVKLYPGDIGAATGFVTDEDARVVDTAGAPVPGLYAVGNDMHSIMGGVYTGPGITIGPGLVFGYLAGRHAAARAAARSAAPELADAAVRRERAATSPATFGARPS
jgi:succinate dehydrogenase/fumarate reductase flavoprotein subunit